MKKIKAILFDVDDTLYSHSLKRIPELTKKTILKLKQNGYHLGICTSRFPREFYSLPQDDLKIFDMIIAGTGSIYIKKDNVFHVEKLEIEDTKKYIDFFKKHPNIFYLWTPLNGEPHFSSAPNERIFNHQVEWSGYCPSIQPWNGEELINIIYYNASDAQSEEIIQLVGEESLERWGNCGHINPKGVNKAFGVKKFCEFLGLRPEEIICFGDGRNDISMIESAGIGIAVGNAHEELKKHADYVCDTIENGGIYTICVELGLIAPIDSKLFFFDIDGTTYRHDIQDCPTSTIIALNKLKENGYKICICTSRSQEEMIHLPHNFLNLFDGIIYLAGGHIQLDKKDYLHEIDKEDVKNAIQYLNTHKIPYRYVTKDLHGYLYHSTEFVRGLFQHLYNMTPPEKCYENESLIHFQYYPFTDEQNNDLINRIKHSKITHLKFSHEVTQENLDKAKAIEIVANYYGYTRENTVAFGDGLNDITMLQNAQIGIAMGNANKLCKEASDYVTNSIDQDGLYHACLHFKWIK